VQLARGVDETREVGGKVHAACAIHVGKFYEISPPTDAAISIGPWPLTLNRKSTLKSLANHRLAFVALAHQACDVLGKAHIELEMDPERECSFQLEMGGVPFLVVHGDTLDAARFSVYARLGQPPADDARAYRRLLEINPLLLASANATLGMDSQSGDIVLAFQEEIAAFHGDSLLDRLDDAVDLAIRWREDRFEAAQARPDWPAAMNMV
jgi:hypothetical protein